ncbi:MAG: adenosylcobinamide-GDP ribazoletransferase, partial [Chloroflexota bacterium]
MRERWVSTLGRVAAAPLVAAGFLTVMPIPAPRSVAMGPMGWPLACFPLVGAALGALVAGVGVLLELWFPAQVVAPLMVALLLAVTGALHLDGLMDSFDGLFGGRDPSGR